MITKCYKWQLTCFDNEVSHDKGHGVSWIDVVATVDVFAVDGETETRQEFDDTSGDHPGSDLRRV